VDGRNNIEGWLIGIAIYDQGRHLSSAFGP